MTLVFGDEEVRLVQGDAYWAAQQGSGQTSILNGTSRDAAAVTGRGAALGDGLEKVLSAYGISEEDGFWISTPGATSSLILAYSKEETQWNLLPAQDIGAVVPWLSGTTEEVPGEFLLIYRFDFESPSAGGALSLAGYQVFYL